PVAELAGAVGADPLNLHRVLRLLATRGIFTEDDAGRFALTPSAELLRTDVPSSFAPAVLMITDTTFWRPAGELEETVRTGRTPFDRLFGMPFFEHFARDPGTAAVFHVGMASMSDPENPVVARAFDLPPDATVVDVGGGHGGLLLSVLREHPDARGVLFDQPHVLAGHRLGELGADDRWELAAGDFFTGAPPGDAYLLKRILHDWDDDAARAILAGGGPPRGRPGSGSWTTTSRTPWSWRTRRASTWRQRARRRTRPGGRRTRRASRPTPPPGRSRTP
ncbi:hypothetical protein K7G98_23175, partial [Saccharothrix sp. MB29]|nr:hypothetical protein [Saccharothrix sp. MB29]